MENMKYFMENMKYFMAKMKSFGQDKYFMEWMKYLNKGCNNNFLTCRTVQDTLTVKNCETRIRTTRF